MHSHKQLARMRIELHLVAGREEDRLIFDLQRQVAERLGYQDNESSIKSEQLMKQMYRATKTVKQLNGILLPMLKGRVFSSLPRIVYEIDDKYYQVGNAIAVRNVKLFKQQPHEIFNIIRVMQAHNDINQIAPRTLRAWWQAAQKIGPDFYADSENRKMFISMFRRGAGLTHILRFFNLYGMLGRYIRPWAKIVGLLQHDLFHIYPVDDHILMVVRNMRRLAIEAHSHELPFASGLMASFPYKTVLYLAALFHDIAKGRGGDHADLGVADAAKFAKDHFLTDYETDLLCWLVQDHLIMSTTSQKEDISDPEVVNRFCAHVNVLAALPHRRQTLAVMPHSACAHSMSHLPERAMSSIERMPASLPPSVTGRRRTCAARMISIARRMSAPASTVTGSRDMMLRTVTAPGSPPDETQRTTMSRSVSIPASVPSSSHTGSAPMPRMRISRAAATTGSSGCVTAAAPVM